MNWDAIGAIGELIGAIAVFATLIYLAVQIRQSNRLALAQYREMNRLAMVDITDPIIRDRDLADLIERTRLKTDDADAADVRRVRSQLQNELLAAQSLFVRGQLVGEKRMERVSTRLAINTIENHVIAQDIWMNVEFDEAFTRRVNESRGYEP